VKFVVDENVDRSIVHSLRSEGHEVWYVAEARAGVDDGVVLDEARRRQALLVTADKDFGHFVVRMGRGSSGVFLLRLEGMPLRLREELVLTVVRSRGASLHSSFTVIDRSGVRQRPIQH